MLLLNKEQIEKVFNMRDAIEANKEAFSIFNKNECVTPLRTNISADDGKGSILFMPSYSESLQSAGLKVVSVFPENAKIGKPVTPASVILVDAKNGEVICILDGTYVTKLRTGAASGAAIDLLALKNAKIGALIGTDGQADMQLAAMLEARDLDEVRIYSRNIEKVESFIKDVKKSLSGYISKNNTKLIPVCSSDEAIENADIVVLVTTSKSPVINGEKLKDGAFVSGVGSYMPDMHEIDEITLKRASKIYFDSKEAVLSEAGCIITPLNKKVISKVDFTGDLGELILGRISGRKNEKEIIVFKTVGIGIMDLVAARKIYDKALERNIGMKWE